LTGYSVWPYNTHIEQQTGANQMQQQIEQIRAKVQQCIKLAEDKFGITMPKVDVRFDLTGRAAGMAGMRYGHFYLRFNRTHMALGGKTWEHLLNDTVPHEVAHTVCQAFPKFGRNHDAGWRRVCIALGGNGSRCYGENDAPEAVAQQRPWVYITTTGHEVRVTKVIHSKIQQGAGYIMKGGKGKLNNQCQYNYMTAPAVKAAAKPVVVNTPAPVAVAAPVERATVAAQWNVPAGASNAERVRGRIAVAKRNGEAADAVVEWAVVTLGMKRQLAKAYVKNNWSKV
jgi:SprT protein